MPETKIALFPCSPARADEVAAWLNENAAQRWQVEGNALFLPFLARFRRGEGGPYRISGVRDAAAACRLRDCGWVLPGPPAGDEGFPAPRGFPEKTAFCAAELLLLYLLFGRLAAGDGPACACALAAALAVLLQYGLLLYTALASGTKWAPRSAAPWVAAYALSAVYVLCAAAFVILC